MTRPLVSAADFQTLWRTLGPSIAGAHPRATLREPPVAPETSADTTVRLPSQLVSAEPTGSSLHTLPRLSIAPLVSGYVDPADLRDIVVTGTLGEGGMGRVLLAKQRSLSREVAVKMPHVDARPGIAQALIAEGVITGSLEHPNIVPVHALGRDAAGQPILVMKRLSGVAWSEVLNDSDHPAWTKLLSRSADRLRAHIEILMSVCQAVSFAHSRGILHRDIKPENVMLGEFGEVYLLDFGVAVRLRAEDEASEARQVVGTPAFMAPEMVDTTLPIGTFSDVYLLGATLHVISAHTLLHQGDTLETVLLAAYLSAPFEYGEGVPSELAALCRAATHRDPAQRPESALQFRQKLADYLAHESSLGLSRAAGERLLELERRAGSDPARALRAAAECHFGYLNALREWPENPSARAGLRRCLLVSIALEVRLENVSAARALLAELDDPPASLVTALSDAEREVAQRTDNAARLRRIDHDSDLSVASAARRRLMLLLAAWAASIGLVVIVLKGAFGFRMDLLGSTLAAGASLLVAMGLARSNRSTLYDNAVNRRLLWLMFVTMCVSFAHRIQLLVVHGTASQAYESDLLITLIACVANGIFVHRSWLRGAAILALASVISGIEPAWAEPAFGLSVIAVLVHWALAWKPEGRANTSTGSARREPD